MVKLAHFIGRWRWVLVGVVAWALVVSLMVEFAWPPYANRILCPTNLPNCHDIPAPWPIEPWAVAAGFLYIGVVAFIARRQLDRRGW
jgi:hypothetical protein